jgi:MFS family permease
VIGSALIVVGGVLFLPLSPEWTNLDVVLRLGVIGIGTGVVSGPNQAAILATAPAALLGAVGALSGLARTLGFALGPALATALWWHGELTPDAMRPPFALVALLPALVLAGLVATIVAPRKSRGAEATTGAAYHSATSVMP